MKIKFCIIIIIPLFFISCNKIDLKKKSYFKYSNEKYKIENYTFRYFSPTLMLVIFESDSASFELMLSDCSDKELKEGDYIYNGSNYDFRFNFTKPNGTKLYADYGNINIIKNKNNKYKMDFDININGVSKVEGVFNEDIFIENKENTFLYDDNYYNIDTVIVERFEGGGGYYHDTYYIYIYSDYDNSNAPHIGFATFAWSTDKLSDAIRNYNKHFVSYIYVSETEWHENNSGVLKTKFIENKTDSTMKYDLYFNMTANDNKRIIGGFVGDIQISYLNKNNQNFFNNTSYFDNFFITENSTIKD